MATGRGPRAGATPLRAIIVEDDPYDAELIVEELRRAGFDLAWARVTTEAELLEQLDVKTDVVLADYTLPQFSAPSALALLRDRKLDVPLIVVTGSVGEEIAVRCMRGGAADYLLKDRLTRLGPAIRRAVAAKRARDERRQALAALAQSEERHRSIAELTSDYSYLVRALPGGGYACDWISGSFSRITGYDPSEIASSDDWDRLVYEEDRPVLRRHLRALREGKPHEAELRLITRAGQVRRMRLRGRPAIDERDRRIFGFFGAAQDITERHRAEQAARLLTSAIEQTSESVIISSGDLSGPGPRIVYVNPAFTAMTGYTLADAHGQPPSMLNGPQTDLATLRQIRLTLARGDAATGQLVNYRKDGREILVEWRVAPIKDEQGKTTHFVAVQTDVTERGRMEQALRESEERYAVAARGSNDGLWDWDLRSQRLYVSDRWRELVGCGDVELAADPGAWYDRVHPIDLDLFRLRMDELAKGLAEQVSIEIRMLHQDGSYRWMLVRGAVCRDEEQRLYRMAGSMTDVTDQKEAEAALVNDALHDALTGLPNRTLLLDRVTSALVRSQRRDAGPVGILAIDLDRFKLVNDSLGLTAGDELLRGIARRLTECLSAADTVARLGGDEFAVLLDEVEDETAAAAEAARLRAVLAAPFEIQGQPVYPAVSMGVATDSGGTVTAEDLLRHAITAMRHAKEQGRNQAQVYAPSMHSRVIDRLQLESDLRRALERNELAVYFQPIVRAVDQVPVALEALIRWTHPTRGVISPQQLIEIAEETGLILQIGEWVAEHAIDELGRWDAAGLPPIRLALNLSARELLHEHLVERISRCLRRGGLPPTRLEIELTETVVMQNAGAAAILLRDLRALGVQIAVDDFGTGYSSLAYLTDLPITSLKIDRSFIQKIGTQASATKIIRTVINMAHDLGLRSVAEGIETPEQCAALVELACDELQGYLFQRPQPMERLVRSLSTESDLATGAPGSVVPLGARRPPPSPHDAVSAIRSNMPWRLAPKERR